MLFNKSKFTTDENTGTCLPAQVPQALVCQYHTVRAALVYPPGQANIGDTPVRDGRY